MLELGNGLAAIALDERPGTGGELHFSLPGKHLRDGTVVTVLKGNRRSWCGIFARGETTFDALVRGPGYGTMVVVSGGGLYVVPTQDPEKYWTVGDGYIEGVLVVEPHGTAVAWSSWDIVVFSDTAAAFDVPVGADGFRLMHKESQFVVGEAYLPERGGFVPFRLDIRDGAISYCST